MGFFKKRWRETSTRIQLVQLASLAVSLGTGLPVELIMGSAAAIAGVGAVVPDGES